MAKRKTKKDYHGLAESRGFKWVGPLPRNTHNKTQWQCKKNHIWKAAYHSVCGSHGCPFCAGNSRKTEKDYHDLAKSRGFKWFGGVLPKNIVTESKWQCEKGHEWETVYNSIQQGSGCPICSKKAKHDYCNLAESRGFKWVGNSLPKNVNTKTRWKCKKNHEWEVAYAAIYSGNGCPFCAGKASKTEQDYHNLANLRSFRWVGRELPKDINIKTWWECEKGHTWKARYNSVQQGNGCPQCNDMINGALVSKPQRKLNNLLCGSLNYPENRYRIDVVIMRKSQKIAVEYDAQYWHEGNEDHDSKRDKCLISCGWKILHIKSGTLLPTRKQIKQAINQLLKDRDIVNLYLEDWC